jgi:hypothetical protein
LNKTTPDELDDAILPAAAASKIKSLSPMFEYKSKFADRSLARATPSRNHSTPEVVLLHRSVLPPSDGHVIFLILSVKH